jgi:uncharacterized protein (UPF0332 family)
MHLATNYIKTRILPTHAGKALYSYIINYADATSLELALKADAISYLHSAIVSLSDGIRGVQQGYYTWATVKMYYSAFYALRAILALRNICIFYDGSSPRIVEATIGSIPQKLEGTTHKCIIKAYSDRYPSDLLLSQQIDSDPPLNWLMNKREAANYGNAKFSEPNEPEHFKQFIKEGARVSFISYFSDVHDLYTFDKDHSIVAFPLRCIRIAVSETISAGIKMPDEDVDYLKSTFKDPAGPLSPLLTFIESLR